MKFSFPNGHVDVHAGKKGDDIVFKIIDYGAGMSKKEQALLFMTDSNFTKKGTQAETGTGLGLILSREFIELHGGKLYIKSAPHKGSMFSFTLPSNDGNSDFKKPKDEI